MGLEVKNKNFHCIATVTVEQELKDVFDDNLDKLFRVTSLQLKPDALSAVMVKRRVPILIWSQLKSELKRLTKIGVIVPEVESTQWFSHLVTTKKRWFPENMFTPP